MQEPPHTEKIKKKEEDITSWGSNEGKNLTNIDLKEIKFIQRIIDDKYKILEDSKKGGPL